MSSFTDMETVIERRPMFPSVLFAEDFDAVEIVPPPEPEITPEPEMIEPILTAADLEDARAEGRAAGRAEIEHGLAATRVQMLGLIARGMEDARAASAQVSEAATEAVARTMLSALAACLPALCARHGETELRALVRGLLPSLVNEPRITIRINPLMMQAMTGELTALDAELAERVVLIPAEQMPPGDARLSWQDGSAVRDARQVRIAVEDSLAALGLLEMEMVDA